MKSVVVIVGIVVKVILSAIVINITMLFIELMAVVVIVAVPGKMEKAGVTPTTAAKGNGSTS